MRCISCGADIPPVWVKCLELNRCPGCDGEIMNEASQELLKELAEALRRMPNDPQGVAGWLVSNYRFQKMGDGQPVEKFHHKGGGPREEYDESKLKIAPGLDDFVKRNEAEHLVAKSNELANKYKGSKNSKLAEFASIIQGVGDPYGDDTTEKDTGNDDGPADPEDQKSYLALKASGFDPFASAVAAAPSNIYDLSPDSRSVVDKLAGLMSQEGKPIAYEAALSQTDEGRKQLQMDMFKRIKAQDAISGNGSGVFRR
jgi:hypothetical protein